MSKLSKFIKKLKYISVPIQLTPTNHLELKGKINGMTGTFILDTGASNTCIGLDRLEYFKLITKPSKIKAAGAGATDMDTLISKKNKIKIGKWKNKNMKIVLFDLTHVNQALEAHQGKRVDGIIGADVLNEANAIIDYKNKTVYLRVKKS
jgi:predicted aspartyl protease